MITAMSAGRLATAISRRELTPVEVVDAYIERIEKANPALNAIVTPCFDEARAVAAEVDRALGRRRAPGPPLPPLLVLHRSTA